MYCGIWRNTPNLSCIKIHSSSLHFGWTFTFYYCRNLAHALVIWKLLFTKLSDLPNVDKSFFSVNRVTLMKNYHKPHQKNLEVLGICQGLGFSRFWVSLVSLNFIFGNKYSQLLFLNWQIHFIFNIVFAGYPVTVCPSHPSHLFYW